MQPRLPPSSFPSSSHSHSSPHATLCIKFATYSQSHSHFALLAARFLFYFIAFAFDNGNVSIRSVPAPLPFLFHIPIHILPIPLFHSLFRFMLKRCFDKVLFSVLLPLSLSLSRLPLHSHSFRMCFAFSAVAFTHAFVCGAEYLPMAMFFQCMHVCGSQCVYFHVQVCVYINTLLLLLLLLMFSHAR